MRIEDRFIRIAQSDPDRIAIESSASRWTYRQVLTASQAYAQALQAQRQQLGFDTVAILATRSATLPIVVLACIRAGIAFAVLDSAYPDTRLGHLLESLPNPLVLGLDLTADVMQHRLPQCGHAMQQTSQAQLMAMASHEVVPSLLAEAANEVAYYLFTSGSTGMPKCIQTPPAPLAHFIGWYVSAHPVRAGERCAMLSGLSHDPIFRDIFAPLSTGGVLCVPPQDILLKPDALYAWMQAQRIERMHTTPPMLEILTAGWDRSTSLSALQRVFSGGDALRSAQVLAIRRFAPDCQFINFYGTSETPQAVAWHAVGMAPTDPIPIGRGIDDVNLLVLDEHKNPVASGVQGQIAVRSAYLSDGYVGDAVASSRQFVTMTPSDGRTCYLTGDLGYANADGDIVLTGRADDQINLHGNRIELGDIQAALRRAPGIANALVLPVKSTQGDIWLCAYLVDQGGQAAADTHRVKQFLSTELPSYMIPTVWEWVEAIPLLPNGKVNRQQLAEATLARLAQDRPQTDDALGELCLALQSVLGVHVDPSSSFIDLGGDSLSFIRVSILIEDRIGPLPSGWERIPLAELMQASRISEAPTTKASAPWTTVETTLLLRVVSILLVTMSHTGVNAIVLMATSTLFVVSGMSFSKFLRPTIQGSGRLAPTLAFIVKFGIPAGLWQALRGVVFHRFWLPDLLLIGTFFQKPGDAHFTFWYLDVLAANVVLLALIGKADYLWRRCFPRLPKAAPNALGTDLLWVALGLTAAYAQVVMGWWNADVGHGNVGPFKWFWMLAFGVAISHANTFRRKWLLSALLLAFATAQGMQQPFIETAFDHQIETFFYVTTLLLIWVDRVPVPRLLRPWLVEIGSATLMIYIVNYSVINMLLPHLHLPQWLWLQVVTAVTTGILAHRGWNKVTSRVTELARRR